MLKKIIAIIFIFLLSLILLKPGFQQKSLATEIEEFTDHYSITFPAGSFFCVVLSQPLDTSIAQENDIIETVLPYDMYLGNVLFLPKGSKAFARVVYIERAHQGRNSLINLRFYSIIPAGGKTTETPINAYILDENEDGSLGGTLTDRSEMRKVVHKLEFIGPIVQGIPTGPRLPGKEIYIPAGERWVIQLLEPATFTVYK